MEEKPPKKKQGRPFDLEKRLKKEKTYLQPGFEAYLYKKGAIVENEEDYDKMMKEYKEA